MNDIDFDNVHCSYCNSKHRIGGFCNDKHNVMVREAKKADRIEAGLSPLTKNQRKAQRKKRNK